MNPDKVDYRGFCLRKINEPEFSHLKLLSFWPAYFLAYVLLESVYLPETHYAVYIPADNWIPFCEWFVIPYVFWYLYLIGISLYMLFYDVQTFRSFMRYLMVTTAVAAAAYLLFPSCQNLRPETFRRENILTRTAKALYMVDTNTNVCPSLHVMHAFAVMSAGLRARGLEHKLWSGFFIVTTSLIVLSTVFIKQHSLLDTITALPVCAVAEWISYGGKPWGRCSKKKTV